MKEYRLPQLGDVMTRILITLLLAASCGSTTNEPKNCKDHVHLQNRGFANTCRWGAKLVVEDRVAVCRCPKPEPITTEEPTS